MVLDNACPVNTSTLLHWMVCQGTVYGIEVKRGSNVPMCLSSSMMNCT